jgi:mono/diheme cytochrome c family protein
MFKRPSLFVTAASSLVAIAASSVYLGAGAQAPAPVSSAPAVPAAARQQAAAAAPAGTPEAVVRRYCMGCHNSRTKSGNLSFTDVDLTDIGSHPEIWERVVRKVGAGMMPPAGMPRPDPAAMDGFLAAISNDLDRAFDTRPDPGRTEPLHRLNRTEYANAIRDLLVVDIDAADFLPADDASYGFDNMAGVLRLSQALMERYLSAAKTIARMAVGTPLPTPDGKTYRIPPDVQQHDRMVGLPFGTRGGTLVQHLFPQTGSYEFKIEVAGAAAPKAAHKLELTIDGVQVKTFDFAPVNARGPEGVYEVDGKLAVTLPVTGGPHDIGVAFYRKPADLVEQVREPFPNPRISGNDGGPGGSMPVVTNVSIVGPYEAEGPGSTPSRQRIFVCRPTGAAQEATCARTVIERLARRAYRGNVASTDIDTLLTFYRDGRKEGGSFDSGIESAIRRMLVDPNFLFRIETAPAGPTTRQTGATARTVQNASATTAAYRVSDVELASRLSFFLWSSIPDDELLDLAARGRLKDPVVLEQQVKRMVNDPRSVALTKNFAGQWLLIRNIATVRPGDPFSLAFDETLREAMDRESELFFDSVIRENRPVPELLTAHYTFLNERLAEHYGIPGVQGNHFRRVDLPADSPRGGILGQGSVLTVTSHAIRTSPVIRGKWILNNILGAPPPDPPPNVPALPEQRTQAKTQTMRQRMAAHRANPVCATCHNMIDPAGFALENFDAIGRWRTVDESFNPIDASGQLPDGSKFNGVADLKQVLTAKPERFTKTVAEKMLTYALGRGLEYYDMPAVRRIVADAAKDDYRFQSLILGIVRSYPFTMRRAEPAPASGTSAAH